MPRLIVRSVVSRNDWSYDRSHDATIDCAIDRCPPRLIVGLPSVLGCHDWSYARSQDATIARTIGRRMQRSFDRTIGRRPSRLIVHRSLIASRTISYDGSCHRYSPIVRDSATTRRDRSRYATATGDRSKHSVQSYDPEIIRSSVTVALGYFHGSDGITIAWNKIVKLITLHKSLPILRILCWIEARTG